MAKCIIVDIDGTLSNPEHRRHHVHCDRPNWPAFNAAMGDDPPVGAIVRLVQLLSKDHSIVLATGREEPYRRLTLSWLLHHDVPYKALFMRAEKDYRPDEVVKSEMLDQMLEWGWEPEFVIDDRDKVVKMWRSRGLICLQCADGNF